MKKSFVCIFPGLDNAHLTKDIGQIGNAFSELADVQSSIVCYGNKEYPTLKTETKNQTIVRVEDKGRVLFFEKAILRYLRKEAKKIDILHVQQLNKADIYQVLLYKFLNPKGKILLKQDMHIPDLEKGIRYSRKGLFNSFHKFFEKKAHKKIDLIAVDSNDLLKAYGKEYPETQNKLVVLSHNLNDHYIKEHFPVRKSFQEKENIILTTGRIGAADKNYEMLLDTLPLLELNDWKVYLVGEIHNDFDKRIDQLIIDNPQLKGRVFYTGQIDDRVALYEYYNRAKIFCLTSVLESFGVSFIEALFFNNYIVGTTGMSSFDYISNQRELGEKVEVNDTKELAKRFNHIMQNENIIEEKGGKAHQHVSEHFFLSTNIQVLRRLLD
ncbi:MAG: glycosyltransferase [Vicingaceae bacterium]|nr:glycosyltransferase [Vicingaceae bacterium]